MSRFAFAPKAALESATPRARRGRDASARPRSARRSIARSVAWRRRESTLADAEQRSAACDVAMPRPPLELVPILDSAMRQHERVERRRTLTDRRDGGCDAAATARANGRGSGCGSLERLRDARCAAMAAADAAGRNKKRWTALATLRHVDRPQRQQEHSNQTRTSSATIAGTAPAPTAPATTPPAPNNRADVGPGRVPAAADHAARSIRIR